MRTAFCMVQQPTDRHLLQRQGRQRDDTGGHRVSLIGRKPQRRASHRMIRLLLRSRSESTSAGDVRVACAEGPDGALLVPATVPGSVCRREASPVRTCSGRWRPAPVLSLGRRHADRRGVDSLTAPMRARRVGVTVLVRGAFRSARWRAVGKSVSAEKVIIHRGWWWPGRCVVWRTHGDQVLAGPGDHG